MGYPKEDADFMGFALTLAQQSKPSPNPRVGAVLVKNNQVLGEGYHSAPGNPHAEIEALRDAAAHNRDVSGATLYVTLEPCCHTGRTGPCTIAVHEANIRRIVVGMEDPDLHVAGKGIAWLKQQGHIVDVGVLETECKKLLDSYIQHRRLKRPLFHLKAAITLDGYIATASGDSKWITGPAARAKGHALRAIHDAILVGIGTVLADDPTLTVRDADGPNPTRVILDSKLRIPLSSKLLSTTDEADVILFHGPGAAKEKIDQLKKIDGVTLRCCAQTDKALDLHNVVDELNALGFLSVLIEGGSAIHGAFINAKLADRFSVFIAPKLIGNGIPWVAIPGVGRIKDGVTAVPASIKTTLLECDTLIEGEWSI